MSNPTKWSHGLPKFQKPTKLSELKLPQKLPEPK